MSSPQRRIDSEPKTLNFFDQLMLEGLDEQARIIAGKDTDGVEKCLTLSDLKANSSMSILSAEVVPSAHGHAIRALCDVQDMGEMTLTLPYRLKDKILDHVPCAAMYLGKSEPVNGSRIQFPYVRMLPNSSRASNEKLQQIRERFQTLCATFRVEDYLRKKSLAVFPPNKVFEILTARTLLDVGIIKKLLLVSYTTVTNGENVEGEMFLPYRLAEEALAKVPALGLYKGYKPTLSETDKKCHDFVFVDGGAAEAIRESELGQINKSKLRED